MCDRTLGTINSSMTATNTDSGIFSGYFFVYQVAINVAARKSSQFSLYISPVDIYVYIANAANKALNSNVVKKNHQVELIWVQ